MQTPENNSIIVNKWFAAFNAHDLEKILELYHDEAEHYSPKLKQRQPETNGLVRGKSALADWWRDSFERLPTLQYLSATLTANENRVFMEYTRKVEGEPDNFAEVLEIKDGLIIASRVYHG